MHAAGVTMVPFLQAIPSASSTNTAAVVDSACHCSGSLPSEVVQTVLLSRLSLSMTASAAIAAVTTAIVVARSVESSSAARNGVVEQACTATPGTVAGSEGLERVQVPG